MKFFKNNQSGRSMVEMLGVLAIIGVLSVGAIAGYSKAMFKYKMNKTLDVLSHAITRIVELDTMNFGVADEIISGTQVMKEYGIMPDCDPNFVSSIEGTEDMGGTCPLPNGEMAFGMYSLNGKTAAQFLLYTIFTEEPFESCVAFFNSEIYKNVPKEWEGTEQDCNVGGYIIIDNGEEDKEVYSNSPLVENLGGGFKSELTNSDILDACELCKNEYCVIAWMMKYDTCN